MRREFELGESHSVHRDDVREFSETEVDPVIEELQIYEGTNDIDRQVITDRMYDTRSDYYWPRS
jgi:hypothetical protein